MTTIPFDVTTDVLRSAARRQLAVTADRGRRPVLVGDSAVYKRAVAAAGLTEHVACPPRLRPRAADGTFAEYVAYAETLPVSVVRAAAHALRPVKNGGAA